LNLQSDKAIIEGRQRNVGPERKTDLLSVSAGVFWLAVNLPPWSFFDYKSMALILLGWGTGTSATNLIFPLTYAMAIFTIVFSFIRFHRNLGKVRSAFLAITTPFAFVGVYEAVYQNLSYFVRPSIFSTDAAGELLLASWILLGLASIPFWRPSKKFYVLVALDIIGFAVWAMLGYPQIYELNSLNGYALVLNSITKISFALTFLALLHDGSTRPIGRRGAF
jgi:hypothetical protein